MIPLELDLIEPLLSKPGDITAGWLRIDPTSAIAPSRVERGLADTASGDGPLVSRWQRSSPWLADARLRLDALRQLWRERILFFDQDAQQQLLEWLRIPEPDGQKLVLVLTAALSLVLCWLTWQVRREIDPSDLRRHRLLLTPAGRHVAADGLALLSDEFNKRLGRLTVAQQKDLRNLLEKIV